MNNNNRTGRRYDRQFKENAVALVMGGRTQSEVSRDLGVSLWSLGEWGKKARAGQGLAQPKTLEAESPQQRELRRLRAARRHTRSFLTERFAELRKRSFERASRKSPMSAAVSEARSRSAFLPR